MPEHRNIDAIVLTAGEFNDYQDRAFAFDTDTLIDLAANTNQSLKRGLQVPVFVDNAEKIDNFVGEVADCFLSISGKALFVSINAFEPIDERLLPSISLVLDGNSKPTRIHCLRMVGYTKIHTARLVLSYP
jgi:hypothetical protein